VTDTRRSAGVTPPDQEARERIRSDLATTLFVDAGAGSGKTAALVGRVLALVKSGEAELAHIAAITFTEKAAAELGDRIRCELEAFVLDNPGTVEERRCRVALDQLDGAAIGTLHSFARRILSENPIEAGLPPRIEVLDEVSSDVAFDQRWSMFQDSLLADPAMERTLLLFFAAGARPEALRYLARAFEDNWDLVEEQVRDHEPDPPPIHDLFAPLVSAAHALLAQPCSDPGDNLRLRIEEIAWRIDEVGAMGDELSLLEALGPGAEPKLPSFRVTKTGRKEAWDDVDTVRALVMSLGEQVDEVRLKVVGACARQIGSAIRRFTLAAANERQAAGQLQFHDLLVFARSLLRDPRHGADVRVRLHERYQRLLLDEFQDTDPIQIDLAVRIAAADPGSNDAGTLQWQEVEVAPGHLFVVGDPKQSIYRFRRADVATFMKASAILGAAGRRVELTTNFRTGDPIIERVNATFSGLMSEPPYIPLHATRLSAGAGAPVSVLGRHEHPKELKAEDLRAAEAADVAATIARLLHEGWLVDDGAGGWRAARLGDITVLVPARTSLPFLEDALEGGGIAFRAESSSLVYASRAVRDLLMVLRAIDDPTNHLHIVSALRTPLLACGDDDLFRYRYERRGHWSYLAPPPVTVPADDPVLRCLQFLRVLYEERSWMAPSELLDRIARERRAFELGFTEGRPRDTWRRLRFVIDQARAWSEATGGNLRQYLSWVSQQAAEGARVAEAILPETDDDAVRVMTIHAAKGLEFPITIVSGMSTAPGGRRAPAQVVFTPGGVGYRFSGNVTTEEYEAWKPIDEQMGLHERIRLLYVACTRARDHLVVSLHRKARVNDPQPASRTNAELLVEGIGRRLEELPDGAAASGVVAAPPVAPPSPPPPFAEWRADRTAALERAALPRTIAATALTDEGTFDADADADAGVEPDPGLQKRPRDLDLPPWLKGRYGSAVGRAVHGVLQTIDLETGEGLETTLAAQCEAEAVLERAGDVRSLVESALGSSSVREAAAHRRWREVYVCTPVGGRQLEGYIDLLYRTPDGLVVVDYKTSASSEADELSRRVESYRNQGASYALSVEAATGEKVSRVTFMFLTPDGAVERHLEDLDAAMDHVRDLVTSGHEVLVP
jgi:ATP-dependent helicase/nuclease subunit A